MKNTTLLPAALVLALLATACSTVPKTTSLLDQTRNDYVVAQNSPSVNNYAPVELKNAGDAMTLANDAAKHDESSENIDKLAYLAKQKIALAQEAAKQKTAELETANAAKQRDQMRLDQRTNEADNAKIQADNAKAQAAQSKMAADAAATDAAAANAKAAQLQAQMDDLKAKQTERGLVITLGDVLFGTDMATLNPNGMQTVQKLADVLKQNPQRNVMIEGFTDSTGSAAHNQELSERRANAVRSALQNLGIAPARVATHGYGQTFPVAANDTRENRQMNRRVEIIVSDDSGVIKQR